VTQQSEAWFEADFAWIADRKLRQTLEMFHAQAIAGFQEGHYVSAVVLAGGVLEGLLTFALARNQESAAEELRKLGRSPKDLSDWSLGDLSEVAKRLELIGDGPAKAVDAARDFRNLIHPYRLLRRSDPRWNAIAAMALGAVADVSGSLRGRMLK
jgi:hypothetical protein